MNVARASSALKPWAAGTLLIAAGILGVGEAWAQAAGSIRGRVTLEATGDPVHGATVLIVDLGRLTTTGADGAFELRNIPPGTYTVLAQREHLTTARQRVTVDPEREVEAHFALRLTPIHEELTVTATPVGSATTFETFNSVVTLDTFDITRNIGPTLARVLEGEPGVRIRSFGPGSERPIIRGFDGDRVLIMRDGVRTGDLSSQSADHGTTVDPGGLERLEVVRGPATLLYGSNAIGGVVNAVTPQEAFRQSPFTGLRGQLLTDAGTGNDQAGVSGHFQYGNGGWTVWGGGSGRRTDDFNTPEGRVENSGTRQTTGRAGFGYSNDRAFFSLGYGLEDGRYGIPFAGEFHAHASESDGHGHGHDHGHTDHGHGHSHDHDHDHDDDHEEVFVDLAPQRHDLRFDFGVRNLQSRVLDSIRFVVSYLDWRHDELEIEDGVESLGTRFNNRSVVVRAEADQRRVGRLSGRIGAWGQFRDYEAAGAEALAEPTTQRAFAAFAYEQIDFGPARLMFGGRLERNSYDTVERDGPDIPRSGGHVHGDDGIIPPATRDRSFTGASGSVGLHMSLGERSALVTTLTRSFRSPALEELYNFGPHVGNLAFEIGNANLERESAISLDVSVRHRAPRARGELNVFYYNIDNYVFPRFSRRETIGGLRVAQFVQGDSRFAGFDTRGSFGLHEHLWLNLSAGYVNARLTELGEPVPRIPPLHGRVSVDVPYRGFRVNPELMWAASQNRIFRNETPTEGYAIFNLNASYVMARPQRAHIFSVTGYNLTNELYRNHTSLIKDLAPEMGRGIRFSYGVQFF